MIASSTSETGGKTGPAAFSTRCVRDDLGGLDIGGVRLRCDQGVTAGLIT